MNFQSVNNLRNRRFDHNIFGPTHYSIANYCTENRREMAPVCLEEIFTASQHKKDMKNAFGDDFFINNLHLIPDPLKKNLADTLISSGTEDMGKSTKEEVSKEAAQDPPDAQTTLAGITNFFSGVFNILSSAMFKRPKSPVNYYDCVDHESREMAPKSWPAANIEDRDKNGHTNDQSSSKSSYKTNLNSEISENSVKSEPANMSECRAAVAHCEDKLNKVRALLSSKTAPIPTRSRLRRPKKVFVEAGSVEDSFEDAFSPEDFVSLSNESYVEYFSPPQCCDSELYQTESPLVCTKVQCPQESDLQKKDSTNRDLQEDLKPIIVEDVTVPEKTMEPPTNVCKQEIVLSCEDKLSKLKALLLEKRKKNTISMDTSLPEPSNEQPKQTKTVPVNKTKDKRFKNPNRSTSKRKKSKQRRNIDEDMTFANEIFLDEPSSVENSPTITFVQPETLTNLTKCNFFDEVCGRFRSDSITDSEDSFQIVVSDCPRLRRPSDCDSEDSFIVFEDSPDSCYTSNEVFASDSECASDSESDMSDSGCNMTSLSHILTRTVGNLADDDLYDDEQHDEVDCVFNDLRSGTLIEDAKKGLLIKEERKCMKKDLPAKTVTFSTQPPKVHVLRVWAFAAQQARVGPWEGYARDRERFQRRIVNVDMAVSWVLKPQHRSRVMFQRFMPWWNAETRREAAEKKLREVAEKRSEEEKTGEVVENERSEEEKSGEVVENERSEVDSEQSDVKFVLKQEVKNNTAEVEKNEERLVHRKNNDCVEIIPLDDKLNNFVTNHVKEVLNT